MSASPKKRKVVPAYGVISRYGKKGTTLAVLSEKLGVTRVSARTQVLDLIEEGKVEVVGKVETGKRGRPALIYARKMTQPSGGKKVSA